MLPQRYVFLPTAAILGTTHMIGLGGTAAKPAQACIGATVLNGLPCVVRRRKIREKKLERPSPHGSLHCRFELAFEKLIDCYP